MNPFSSEHELFRQAVRRFVQEHVLPNAPEWELQGRIPGGIWRLMGELGFLGILQEPRWGGSGADLFMAGVFLQEIGRAGFGGFSASVAVQQFMATAHLARVGSDAQKTRYLAPSVAGTLVGALAVSEANVGSDVAQLETRAKLEGDHYLLQGSKMFITNGAWCDFFTVAARTGGPGAEGLSLFLVDAGLPGVQARALSKIGWHCSGTAEIGFDRVVLPREQLIGQENRGFYYIMESFQLERLAGAFVALGGMEACLQTTLEYMARRKAFQKPLSSFQALRHRLADLMTRLEAARQLTCYAAWRMQQGEVAVRECSMAKLYTTELANELADACLQCHGGYGYMEEAPIARMYRDARVGTIVGGTSEIMREIIARVDMDQVRYSGVYNRGGGAESSPATAADGATAPERTPGSPGGADPFARLISRLDLERLAHATANLHLHLSGEGAGDFTLLLANGRAETRPGLVGDGACRLECSAETWARIACGELTPEAAFMNGAVAVSDLPAMMEILRLFAKTPD